MDNIWHRTLWRGIWPPSRSTFASKGYPGLQKRFVNSIRQSVECALSSQTNGLVKCTFRWQVNQEDEAMSINKWRIASLKLNNPVVIASCPATEDMERLCRCGDAG